MGSDAQLIRIVDAAFAEAARRSGPWLVCRPGCAQCCLGEFPITQLDAARLRRGLEDLESRDPARAARVRQRARAAADPMADDEPCPALDPDTGTCDLYDVRPITCRAYGPPVRCESGEVGVCELCYEGAGDDQIAACMVECDSGDLESALVEEQEERTGVRGATTVALALSS